MRVIIIGGGWAGCSAAITAKKAGAKVSIYEKTDLLLGLGNVGGIIRNNGRYTAAEELINLGSGELIDIMDRNAIHKNVDFSEHKHATLCDVNKLEPEVRTYLLGIGIEINLVARVSNIEKEGNKITALKLSDNTMVPGDVFIDATGSTGAMDNCARYGNGCVMCILRCPTFGPRVSISAKAGIQDIIGERNNGTPGAFSGSCEVSKDSLSSEILEELNERGVVILKIPKEDQNHEKLKLKVCQQYALDEFAENLILLDTGHIKVMSPYYPIDKLRKLPGMEDSRFIDPYSGGQGNSIRYLSSAPRTDDMKVTGAQNLFCAGEKAGFFVGHTEAISTGALAGHNAVRHVLNIPLLILSKETAIGDLIYYANYRLNTKEGKKVRLTFSGGEYFERMKSLNLYNLDNEKIKNKIENLGLKNIYSIPLLQL